VLGSLSLQLIGLLGLLSEPTVEQITADKVLDGPGRFCSEFFAVDLVRSEKMTRKWGPDFYLYFFEGSTGGFGLYEGFAPNTSDFTRSAVEVAGFPKAERLTAGNGQHGYLIPLKRGAEGPQFFLHLYGAAWRGDDRDLALISRLKLGDPKENHCPKAEG
jgi:hypothetical protein